MLGFLKKLYDKPDVVLVLISWFVLLFLFFSFNTGKRFKYVNNLDIIWTRIGVGPAIAITLVIIVVAVLFYWCWYRKIDVVKIMLIVTICASILPTVSGMVMLLSYENNIIGNDLNKPMKWFMENDPEATIAIEDENAFRDTGLNPALWRHVYADMIFWLPDADVRVMSYGELQSVALHPYDKDIDYIFTPSCLPPHNCWYPDEFHMNFSGKTMTWYIYEIM